MEPPSSPQGRVAVGGRLSVGADGRVVSCSAWTGPECVGHAVTEVFDPSDRPELEAVRAQGWIGLDERRWVVSGRVVAVAVERPAGAEDVLVFHDVTAWDLVETARVARRLSTSDAELAGGLARELTDPMAVVQGRIELLLELGVEDPATVRKHLEIAVGHARRVTATLRNLRSVGRKSTDHEAADVGPAVAEALDLVGPRSDRVLVRIEPPDLAVAAEHALLVRVLSSLVRLGLETSGRAAVHLRATRSRGRVLVRIGPIGRDTGAALSPEIDLSLDRALLQSIGGEVQAFPTPHGVSFDLWLSIPSRKRVRPLKRTATLWVVGSDQVREAVGDLLENDGYDLRPCGDPLEVLRRDPTACDGLVSELLLDGSLSGLALARWFLGVRRGPCVLLADRAPAVPWPGVGVVTFPLSRIALVEALGRSGA